MQTACLQNCVRYVEKAAELLKGLSQNGIRRCFEGWKVRMERCVASDGHYVEGHNM